MTSVFRVIVISRSMWNFKARKILKLFRKQVKIFVFWLSLSLIFGFSYWCSNQQSRDHLFKKLIASKLKEKISWCAEGITNKPLLNHSGSTAKWIVSLTTGLDGTALSELLEAVHAARAWTLLLLETNDDTSLDQAFMQQICRYCIYLNRDSQLALGYRISEFLDERRLHSEPRLRNNIGYLYAIQNNAQYIYNPKSWKGIIKFIKMERKGSLSAIYEASHYQGLGIYPPTIINGLGNEKPIKGVADLFRSANALYLHTCLDSSPAVYHIFDNPAHISNWMNSTIASSLQNILTPILDVTALSHDYSDSHNIYYYPSFWSLIQFPFNFIEKDEINVTLSYHNALMQKIFELINQHSLVINYKQEAQDEVDSPESPLIDDKSYAEAYKEISDICWNLKDPIDCWLDAVEQIRLLSQYHNMYRAWVLDLLSLNYSILCHSYVHGRQQYGQVGSSCHDTDTSIGGIINFAQGAISKENSDGNRCQLAHHLKINQQKALREVILLVTFNYPYYDLIPTLDYLYGGIFKNIFYCGENLNDDGSKYQLPSRSSHNDYNINFLSVSQTNRGFYLQACLAKLLNLGLGDEHVRGFMYMSDDVLLNIPMFNTFNLEGIAFLNFGADDELDIKGRKRPVFQAAVANPSMNKIADVSSLMRCRKWDLENGHCGNSLNAFYGRMLQNRQRILKSLIYLKKTWIITNKANDAPISNFSNPELETLHLANCYSRLVTRTGGHPGRVFYGEADIFYFPSRLSKPMLAIIKVFLKFNVMLEIAVATALACAEDLYEISESLGEGKLVEPSPKLMTYFRYNHYWNKKRADVLTLITRLRYSLYIHPFKFKQAQMKHNMTNRMICDILQQTTS